MFVSKDAAILKSPDRPVGFDTELAPFVIDAVMQEGGGYYLGKLLSTAKPLMAWAADTLGITAKNAIVAQAQRADELVNLFDKGNAADSIALGNKTYQELPYQKGVDGVSNASGTTKVIDTGSLSDEALTSKVFEYAKQLSGKELAQVDAGVWRVQSADGTVLNVRSVSNSGVSRWTVDVQNSPTMLNIGVSSKNRYEIKFK